MNETRSSFDATYERAAVREAPAPASLGWVQRVAKRLVYARLQRLEQGAITVVDGIERTQFGHASDAASLRATVTVVDPHTYLEVALGGTIGVSEAYRAGFWTCDDLTSLIRIFVLNRDLLDAMEGGLASLSRPLFRTLHWWNRNTRSGSRRNIAAHYDLGNEFFRLMLDETMMYSCGYFERPDATLAEASRAKNDCICRKLELSPSDHLLEIGTGWGGFAIHAAWHYGCRVTTTTISRQQYEVAVRRAEEAGLSDRVTVLLRDYRELPSLGRRFDKLVSIEMIEAVGHEYYATFFDVCRRMLSRKGLMLIQAITMDERLYERAKRSVDFIQHAVFPGSCIPSISTLIRASSDAGRMTLVDLEDIGAHYAATLRAWRRNVVRARQDIAQLGYQPDFLRLWEFYLCYCEGGFLERSISNVQLLFSQPGWRPAPVGC
jgi:cyclopropane-fatty-acyl-phospholipid synthase